MKAAIAVASTTLVLLVVVALAALILAPSTAIDSPDAADERALVLTAQEEAWTDAVSLVEWAAVGLLGIGVGFVFVSNLPRWRP